MVAKVGGSLYDLPDLGDRLPIYYDPDAVRGYLSRHRDVLSPLSIREAAKHL